MLRVAGPGVRPDGLGRRRRSAHCSATRSIPCCTACCGCSARTASGGASTPSSPLGVFRVPGHGRRGPDAEPDVDADRSQLGQPRQGGGVEHGRGLSTGSSAARWAIRYEERHPQWQFAFVFNTNRCIGCQTCTMACKSTWTFSKGQELMWWNNVETKPYGGYPQHWDAKLLAMLEAGQPRRPGLGRRPRTTAAQKPYGTFEGKTIFEAADKHVGPEGPQNALGYLPTDAEWRHPNIHEDTAAGDKLQQDGPVRRLGASCPSTQRLVLLPGPDLQPLHLPRLPGALPAQGDLQAARGRHRADRPGALPRLSQVRRGLPVQEGRCTAPTTRHEREVHRLLPADRGQGPDGQPRRAPGRDPLHVGLRRQDPPARAGADRRRRASGPRTRRTRCTS